MTYEQRHAHLWQAAEVPKRHVNHADVRADDAPKAWHGAHERVVNQIGSGFLYALVGLRGSGKTQIGVNAIIRAVGLKRRCRYVAAMRTFLELRATFKSEVVTELDVLSTLIEPDLLVIDEWQERGETEWEDRLLTYIVDQRYSAMRDTILISNLDAKAFAESAGPSIVSRLTECGGIIVCDWPSFRTPKESK